MEQTDTRYESAEYIETVSVMFACLCIIVMRSSSLRLQETKLAGPVFYVAAKT